AAARPPVRPRLHRDHRRDPVSVTKRSASTTGRATSHVRHRSATTTSTAPRARADIHRGGLVTDRRRVGWGWPPVPGAGEARLRRAPRGIVRVWDGGAAPAREPPEPSQEPAKPAVSAPRERRLDPVEDGHPLLEHGRPLLE